EDGIRDYKVTGVQTCALPICLFTAGIVALAAVCLLFWLAKTAPPFWHNERNFGPFPNRNQTANLFGLAAIMVLACGQDDIRKGRSEERRVGKECRSREWRYDA